MPANPAGRRQGRRPRPWCRLVSVKMPQELNPHSRDKYLEFGPGLRDTPAGPDEA